MYSKKDSNKTSYILNNSNISINDINNIDKEYPPITYNTQRRNLLISLNNDKFKTLIKINGNETISDIRQIINKIIEKDAFIFNIEKDRFLFGNQEIPISRIFENEFSFFDLAYLQENNLKINIFSLDTSKSIYDLNNNSNIINEGVKDNIIKLDNSQEIDLTSLSSNNNNYLIYENNRSKNYSENKNKSDYEDLNSNSNSSNKNYNVNEFNNPNQTFKKVISRDSLLQKKIKRKISTLKIKDNMSFLSDIIPYYLYSKSKKELYEKILKYKLNKNIKSKTEMKEELFKFFEEKKNIMMKNNIWDLKLNDKKMSIYNEYSSLSRDELLQKFDFLNPHMSRLDMIQEVVGVLYKQQKNVESLN